MNFSWMGAEDELTSAALTVRAQTIPLDDDGTLLFPNFFPPEDVDSIGFQTIDTTDFRPAADRREWGARGRLIPIRTPGTRRFKWVPVESYFTLQEEEINELMSQVRGNQQIFRDLIRNTVPARVDDLTRSNLRRYELDAFSAWLLNQVTQRNPQTGETQVVPLGIDAARYSTAAVAWNGAVNAYSEFIAFVRAAVRNVGAIRGVGMRLNTFLQIQTDAPTNLVTGLPLTQVELEGRISQEVGSQFRFFIVENTVEVFPDGGTDTVDQNIWPAGKIAAIPASGRLGATYRAPVNRAFDLVPPTGAGKNVIDLRGQTVYYDTAALGRELTIECQSNWFSMPEQRRVYVMDTLVP